MLDVSQGRKLDTQLVFPMDHLDMSPFVTASVLAARRGALHCRHS